MRKTHQAMHATIFDNPVFKPLLRGFSRTVLRLQGWQLDFDALKEVDRCVLIGAPHTSNWDLPYALMLAFSEELPIYWMGKKQIFRFPFKNLMMWLGGISIDRGRSLNVVSQAADEFSDAEQLYLVIAPEGTRAKVDDWKSGFYHIAHQAGVPVCPAFIDLKAKRAGILGVIDTNGDAEQQIPEIKALYGDLLLRHKGNKG